MINFTSKLCLDKSFYANLKNSDSEKIIEKTRKIVDTAGFEKLSGGDDITLFAKKHKDKNKIIIRYGSSDIEISKKEEISEFDVIREILLFTCLKNGNPPRNASYYRIIEKIKELLKKAQ